MVTQTASHDSPDAAYCQTVQQQYGLAMPVLFDPNGVTQSVLDMRINGGELVMSTGNIIEFNGGPDHPAVADTLESIYGF